jgi:hypothetical protein
MSDLPPDVGPTGLPSHPETNDDDNGAGRGRDVNWPMVAVLALIGVLVVVIVILHLTGVVGPAGHR